jgi:hypothetical protein
MRRLRNNRMLSALLPGTEKSSVDTDGAALIFRDRLGNHDPQ